MKTIKITCLLGFFIALKYSCFSQETNITGDTIFVNAEDESEIKFPATIEEYRWLSLNPQYKVSISSSSNSIFIHAIAEGVKSSNLSVLEGPGPRLRSHTFLFVTKKSSPKYLTIIPQ